MFDDRVILVTGSSSGIGFATAKLCKERGASVVLHDRDATALAAAVTELGGGTGHIVADLLDPAAPRQIIDYVIETYGRIDGLVNNAARLDRCTIEDMSDAVFDEIMTVNTRAPLMLIQAALPHMERQNTGASVVNIGSVNAHCGAEKILAYSVSKGGLMTATRNLGNALAARGVRVNQMNVGWTETANEHMVQANEGQPKDWVDNIPSFLAPSGHILVPENIAQHVAFWLSDNSAPMTGQIVDLEQYPIIGRLNYNDT